MECKLCCTHGLFRKVVVEAEEVERLRAYRLPIVEHGDQWLIPLPCAAHNGCCAIYPDRPANCRDYECDVLVAVNTGEMPESEARILLERTNELVAKVRAKLPGSRDLWTDVLQYCKDSPEWRHEHADLLLDIIELRGLLHKIDHAHGDRH